MKMILFEIMRQIIWQIAILGKVSQKNTEKSGDSPNWGRGGHPEPNSIFEKGFFRDHIGPFLDAQNMFYTWSHPPMPLQKLLM